MVKAGMVGDCMCLCDNDKLQDFYLIYNNTMWVTSNDSDVVLVKIRTISIT